MRRWGLLVPDEAVLLLKSVFEYAWDGLQNWYGLHHAVIHRLEIAFGARQWQGADERLATPKVIQLGAES